MTQKVVAGYLDGIPLVKVQGDLDRANGVQVIHWGEEASAGSSGALILDMTDCTYIDGGGLGSLFSILQLLAPRGVVVAFGTNPDVERLLEMVGLLHTPYFRVFADEEDVRTALFAGEFEV